MCGAVAEWRWADFDIPAPLPRVCSHMRRSDAGGFAISCGRRWFGARGFEADAEKLAVGPICCGADFAPAPPPPASAPCMCERTFSSFHFWCMFGSGHLVATVTVCLHQLLPMDHQRDKKRMQHVSNLINIWCTNSTQFLYMHIIFKYISWLSPSNDMDTKKKKWCWYLGTISETRVSRNKENTS